MVGYKLEVNVRATSEVSGEDAEYFGSLTYEQRAELIDNMKSDVSSFYRENMDGEINVEVDVTVTEVSE